MKSFLQALIFFSFVVYCRLPIKRLSSLKHDESIRKKMNPILYEDIHLPHDMEVDRGESSKTDITDIPKENRISKMPNEVLNRIFINLNEKEIGHMSQVMPLEALDFIHLEFQKKHNELLHLLSDDLIHPLDKEQNNYKEMLMSLFPSLNLHQKSFMIAISGELHFDSNFLLISSDEDFLRFLNLLATFKNPSDSEILNNLLRDYESEVTTSSIFYIKQDLSNAHWIRQIYLYFPKFKIELTQKEKRRLLLLNLVFADLTLVFEDFPNSMKKKDAFIKQWNYFSSILEHFSITSNELKVLDLELMKNIVWSIPYHRYLLAYHKKIPENSLFPFSLAKVKPNVIFPINQAPYQLPLKFRPSFLSRIYFSKLLTFYTLHIPHLGSYSETVLIKNINPAVSTFLEGGKNHPVQIGIHPRTTRQKYYHHKIHQFYVPSLQWAQYDKSPPLFRYYNFQQYFHRIIDDIYKAQILQLQKEFSHYSYTYRIFAELTCREYNWIEYYTMTESDNKEVKQLMSFPFLKLTIGSDYLP